MAETRALKWIVTGNFTSAGSTAYVRRDGSITALLDEAGVFATKDEAEALRKNTLKLEATISDPYLMEVAETAQGLDPLSARERIRSQGPTVPVRRPDPIALR